MSKLTSRLPRTSSIAEFAEHLGVNDKTVSRWITRGELRVYRIGRIVRISDEDAQAFLAVHRK